ncbi:MAG: GNAT family N-acetyltransferase [Pseudomonadota bacterium]
MLDVAFATHEEREEIAQFMVTAFPRAKWDITGWRKLLANRWGAPGDPFALRVRDAGRIVGCLGLVSARRPTEAGEAHTCGMSSWYMLKDYRGTGAGKEMLEMAVQQEGVTVVNFASSVKAAPVVEAAGLVPLETHRHIWVPGNGARAEVSNTLEALAALNERDRRILADHTGLNVVPWAVEGPEGPFLILLSPMKKHDDYTNYELFYCGNRLAFSECARAIANAVVPEGDVLAVDSRFVTGCVDPDRTEPLSLPRFYTPGRMAPEHVDHIYSENILLGIKIH